MEESEPECEMCDEQEDSEETAPAHQVQRKGPAQ